MPQKPVFFAIVILLFFVFIPSAQSHDINQALFGRKSTLAIIADSIRISIIEGKIEQKEVSDGIDKYGNKYTILPGVLFFSFKLSFKNISQNTKSIDLRTFCITDANSEIANAEGFLDEFAKKYNFFPLWINNDSGTFSPLEKPEIYDLKLGHGESTQIDMTSAVSPVISRYNILFASNEEKIYLIDLFDGKHPKKLWTAKISKYFETFGDVKLKSRDAKMDGLLITFWVINNTPYSWKMKMTQSIKVFQKDGREMIATMPQPDIHEGYLTVSPFDSVEVISLWIGLFKDQESPVLYFAPPIDFAIEIRSRSRSEWKLPREKVLEKLRIWQQSKK